MTGILHKSIIKSFIRRNWRQIYILLAVITDTLSIWFSAYLAFVIRNHLTSLTPLSPRLTVQVFGLSWLSFMFFGSVLGLYRAAYHAHPREQNEIGLKAYFYAIPAIISLMYALQLEFFPPRFMLLFLLFVPAFFVIDRRFLNLFNRLMQIGGYGTFNALIIGFNGATDKIVETYEKIPQLGCRVKGIVDLKKNGHRNQSQFPPGTVPHFQMKKLGEAVADENIDRVFVPSIDDAVQMPELLETCAERNIDLKILSPEFDSLLRFTHVHDIAGIPLFSRKRRKTERLKRIVKRMLDIAGALVALIVFAPVFLIASVAILIEDGQPVFFRQRRLLAEGAKEFDILKFRTMRNSAELEQDDLYKRNLNTGGLFFVNYDPRITRVGRILRKFSLDEVPQFLKVLTGEMSLVGPRPLSEYDVRNITEENRMGGYYKLRANAKPGITGLWQISGRREVSFREMVLLDLYYIENKSIMFDFEILFATVYVVMFGKGGH